MRRAPRGIFVPPTLVLATRAGLWIVEQAVTAQPAWLTFLLAMPLDEIAVVAAAFLFGLLAQDMFYERQSWVWNGWRHLTRRCDVVAVQVLRHVYSNEPRRRIDLNVHLHFVKRVQAARLLLRVYSFAGRDVPPRETPYQLAGPFDRERGDILKVCLYRMPLPYPHWEFWEGGWAPDSPEENRDRKGPVPDGVVAEIELQAGWPLQRFRVFVKQTDYCDGKTSDGLFAIREDKSLFDVQERLP